MCSKSVIAKFIFESNTYEMIRSEFVIGRSSALNEVDIDMGSSNFISRQHLRINFFKNRLHLICLGKNGIFIDEIFKPKDDKSYTLPMNCCLRFPNTKLEVLITQLAKKSSHLNTQESVESDRGNRSKRKLINEPSGYSDDSLDEFSPSKQPFNDEFIYSKHVYSSDPSSRRKQKFVPKSIELNSEIKHGEKEVVQVSNSEDPLISEKSVSDSSQTFKLVSPVQKLFVPASTICDISVGKTSNLYFKSMPVLNYPKTPSWLSGLQQITSYETNLVIVDRGDSHTKPPYSYAQLIAQAIATRPDRQITLAGIYSYISQNYPYYQLAGKGWQNSIRHNLSLNRHFVKVPRSQEESGKGSFWRIDPMYEIKMLNIAFKKRRMRGTLTVPISIENGGQNSEGIMNTKNDITGNYISSTINKKISPISVNTINAIESTDEENETFGRKSSDQPNENKNDLSFTINRMINVNRTYLKNTEKDSSLTEGPDSVKINVISAAKSKPRMKILKLQASNIVDPDATSIKTTRLEAAAKNAPKSVEIIPINKTNGSNNTIVKLCVPSNQLVKKQSVIVRTVQMNSGKPIIKTIPARLS